MEGVVLGTPVDDRRLERSPLVNVIWQIRYTSDVSLANGKAAAELQERLGRGTALSPVQPEAASFQFTVGQAAPRAADPPAWRLTADDGTTVTLAPGVTTLETSGYGSWGAGFSAWVTSVVEAMQETLDPGLQTRVGLRYVNVLFGGALGRPAFARISDLKPYVDGSLLGLAQEEQSGATVAVLQGRQTLGIETSTVILNHALVRTDAGEVGLLVDVDSYDERSTSFDAKSVLECSDKLHNLGLSVFQRLVTNEAWMAMGPGNESQGAK